MDLLYECIVPFEGIGKGRARSGANGHHYTPEKTANWEKAAATFLRSGAAKWDRRPISEACSVSVFFVFKRPPSHYKKNGELRSSAPLRHTQKPDLDNLLKSLLDALVKACVLQDDCLVDSFCPGPKKIWGASNSILVSIYKEA